ncbi:MAG: hypothetical protein U0325_20110 [Polyangiales bacterium]
MSASVRPRPELAALLALVGCASSGAVHGVRLAAVPPDAMASGWARRQADAATLAIFQSLTHEGLAALRRGRVTLDGEVDLLSEAGRERAGRAMPGLRPRPTERRWTVLRRLGDHRLTGWCARGVQVVEGGGPEGFVQRVLTVDRLLLVADGPDGRWGFWLEGLVLDGAAWRWLPWVAWADAVEAPRGAHTDIGMWTCDLERRPPAVSESDSPAR